MPIKWSSPRRLLSAAAGKKKAHQPSPASARQQQQPGLTRSRSRASLAPMLASSTKDVKKSNKNKSKAKKGASKRQIPATKVNGNKATRSQPEGKENEKTAEAALSSSPSRYNNRSWTSSAQQPTHLRFTIQTKIGSGTFSTVHLATHRRTSRPVALKLLSRHKIHKLKTAHRVQAEIDHLRLCAAHPHITRLYDTIDSPGAQTLDLVMEFVPGGDMYDHLKGIKTRRKFSLSGGGIIKTSGLDENDARRYYQQLISAIEFMHSKGVVHRDLKLENVLLDASKRYIKLADFGLSAIVNTSPRAPHNGKMVTPCGSPHYAAPEIILGEPYFGPPVDIWSCGVILYALLTGTLPFVHSNMREQFRRIKAGEYKIPRYLSNDCKTLVKQMLTVRVDKRIGVEGIRQHLWFQVELPEYLNCSPDMTEQRERKEIDEEIMDLVLDLYGIDTNGGEEQSRITAANAGKDGNVEIGAEDYEDGALSRIGLVRAIALGGGLDSTMTSDTGYGEAMRDAHTAYQLLLDAKHEKQRSKELCNVVVPAAGGTNTAAGGAGGGRPSWFGAFLRRITSKSTIAIMLCLILTICAQSDRVIHHYLGGEDTNKKMKVQKKEPNIGNNTWGSFFGSIQSQCYDYLFEP